MRREGKQWDRVTGEDLDQENAKRRKQNQAILKSKEFVDACELVDIKPTVRQASKYRRKKGLAYNGQNT